MSQQRADEFDPNVDPFLMQLVDIVNTMDLGFGITLTVGGTVVTGTMISAADYFKLTGDAHEEALTYGIIWESEEKKREVIAGFRKITSDRHREQMEKSRDTAPNERTRPTKIHLRDARVVEGEGLVPENGTLWRGKLSSIDGYSFGTFRVKK